MSETTSEDQLTIAGPDATLRAPAGTITLLRGEVGSGKSLWLERLAGLQTLPQDVALTTPQPNGNAEPTIRMLFDRNPPLWLGQNVVEELCFGLPNAPSDKDVEKTMHDWRLDKLDLQADVLSLNRLQAVRLNLAAMDIAEAHTALLDCPSDALPVADAMQLIADIDVWSKRSDCVVVVASNRWQDWRTTASQIWHTTTPNLMPKLDSGED